MKFGGPVARFTSSPLYPLLGTPQYILNRRPGGLRRRSGRFGEQENSCALSRKDPWFVSHPAYSLVTTQTTLYWLFKWILNEEYGNVSTKFTWLRVMASCERGVRTLWGLLGRSAKLRWSQSLQLCTWTEPSRCFSLETRSIPSETLRCTIPLGSIIGRKFLGLILYVEFIP